MIPYDFHMHTNFSTDSDATMESMVKKAIELNMEQICFTDHMDYNYPNPPEEDEDYKDITPPLFVFDVDAYLNMIQEMKDKYSSDIRILTGIELGLQQGIEDQIHALLSNHSFDFIIGSSHLLNGCDPYYDSFWSSKTYQTLEEKFSGEELLQQKFMTAVHDYFTEINECIDTYDQFHVYGHLDYLVRYAPTKDKYYHPMDFMDLLTECLTKLIEKGKGIEINTSCLKKGMKYPNPHPDILKLYHDLGGEIITFGADAHMPEHINYRSDVAKDILLNTGFRYITTFEHGKPIFHKL